MRLPDALLLFWGPVGAGLLLLLWMGWKRFLWEAGQVWQDADAVAVAKRREAATTILALIAYLPSAVAFWNLLKDAQWPLIAPERYAALFFVLCPGFAALSYAIAEGIVGAFLKARKRWHEEIVKENNP